MEVKKEIKMEVRENTNQYDLWCYECSVALGNDSPPQDHYRSRAHLNRLLQLGVELPVDEEQLPDFDTFEGIGWSDLPVDDAKIAYCVVCETSIGNAVQAAIHYRSRDHLNRRLQRGLPVVDMPISQNTADRDRFNQYLRRGMPVQQGSLHDVAPNMKGGINGKRKLHSAASMMSGMPKSPISPSSAMPIPSFVNEKRSRPQPAVQKPSATASGRSFVPARPTTYVHNMSYSDASSGGDAGTAYWNPTASVLGGPYETSSFTNTYRSPSASTSPYVASTYRSQETYGAATGQPYYGSRSSAAGQWSTAAPNGDRQSVVFTEGWYCDLCQVPLPTALSLNMHTMSAEHKMMEMRSGHGGQAQMTHWT